MAGFGIFMTFLQFGIAGLVLATIASFLLWLWGKRYIPTEADTSTRRRFLWVCRIAPFAGLLWILAVFVTYSYTNDWFFHRDDGLSTNPHTPLPNGYIIGSVDYHEGYILSPGHRMNGFPHNGDDCVAQVLNLQVTKNYILGNQFVWPTVDISYFIWDLRTRKQFHFTSPAEFRSAAAQRSIWVATVPKEIWANPETQSADEKQGIRIDLVSYWDLYQKYRYTWFDQFAIAVMIAGQIAILVLLIKWGKGIRAAKAKASLTVI